MGAVVGTVVLVGILTALNQVETPGEYSLLIEIDDEPLLATNLTIST